MLKRLFSWLVLGAALLTAPMATAQSMAVNGSAYPSTATAVTITTHGVFQSISPASYTRKGCFIQNTSADTVYVFFGPIASATTGASVKLTTGQALNCASGAIIPQDQVSVTSAASDGVSIVAIFQ